MRIVDKYFYYSEVLCQKNLGVRKKVKFGIQEMENSRYFPRPLCIQLIHVIGAYLEGKKRRKTGGKIMINVENLKPLSIVVLCPYVTL